MQTERRSAAGERGAAATGATDVVGVLFFIREGNLPVLTRRA